MDKIAGYLAPRKTAAEFKQHTPGGCESLPPMVPAYTSSQFGNIDRVCDAKNLLDLIQQGITWNVSQPKPHICLVEPNEII